MVDSLKLAWATPVLRGVAIAALAAVLSMLFARWLWNNWLLHAVFFSACILAGRFHSCLQKHRGKKDSLAGYFSGLQAVLSIFCRA